MQSSAGSVRTTNASRTSWGARQISGISKSLAEANAGTSTPLISRNRACSGIRSMATVQSVSLNLNGDVHLTGTLFNGISQGASYGDDAQQDSNYPLVRFTDGSGNVTYGRTYNWSSTGVQTGNQIVTTECTLPSNVLTNPGTTYSLQVVANGNASSPVTFFDPVWVDFNYSTNSPQIGTFSNPYSTLAQGTNAVPSGGTISIKAGHSPETMKISKPMKLIAIGGTAIIGQQ